jgi:hypothetical protein
MVARTNDDDQRFRLIAIGHSGSVLLNCDTLIKSVGSIFAPRYLVVYTETTARASISFRQEGATRIKAVGLFDTDASPDKGRISARPG